MVAKAGSTLNKFQEPMGLPAQPKQNNITISNTYKDPDINKISYFLKTGNTKKYSH